MKNLFLLFILTSTILIVTACTADTADVKSTTIEPDKVEPAITSSPVPAPGFEDIQEMIVQEDLEADISSDDINEDRELDIAPSSDEKVQVEVPEDPEEVQLKEPFEEVYKAREGYKTYELIDYNIGIEVDPSWDVLGIIDTEYFPETTLYDGWTDTWRNQLRVGMIHNVGNNINLKNFDEVSNYFENFQRLWCKDTQENPVFEVSPTEEGYTTCLEMGDFTFKEVTVSGRQAFHVIYGWKDEFRLPDGEKTKDIYSGWIVWVNLIPYDNDLIYVNGYTIIENVDKKKETILYSINSVKILNDGQPIFENT